MPGWAIALIVCGCLFGGCVTMCSIVTSGSGSRTSAATTDSTTPEFVKTRNDTCSKYKAAPNEIKKSAIFKEYKEAVGKYSVDGLSAKLTKLETTHGGGSLHLVISTSTSKFEQTDIDKSSPVYAMVSDLTEGDSVTFSAKDIHPNYGLLTSEEFFVCSEYWGTDFTSVKKK